MTAQEIQKPEKSGPRRGCLSVLVRLAWIFGGALLLYAGFFVAQGNNRPKADVLFWGFVIVLIIVRFMDVRFLHGETMDNRPATLRDWRRYTLILLASAAALYALARVLAHFQVI